MKKTALLLAAALLAAPMYAEDGAKLYADKKCGMCHGADFKKKDVTVSDNAVKHLTTDAKHKSKVANEAEAKALVEYIKTIKK